MSIETVHVREQSRRPEWSVLDVSGIAVDRVRAYAHESAARGRADVYIERKGGRTYLVAD